MHMDAGDRCGTLCLHGNVGGSASRQRLGVGGSCCRVAASKSAHFDVVQHLFNLLNVVSVKRTYMCADSEATPHGTVSRCTERRLSPPPPSTVPIPLSSRPSVCSLDCIIFATKCVVFKVQEPKAAVEIVDECADLHRQRVVAGTNAVDAESAQLLGQGRQTLQIVVHVQTHANRQRIGRRSGSGSSSGCARRHRRHSVGLVEAGCTHTRTERRAVSRPAMCPCRSVVRCRLVVFAHGRVRVSDLQ